MRELATRVELEESVSVPDDSGSQLHERRRKTYHLMIVLAVLLAVVGSPLLMRGFAGFAAALSAGVCASSAGALRSAGLLVISASPLALAGFTWHRARSLERLLDDDEIRKYAHH